MMHPPIYYREGYKYQLSRDWTINVGFGAPFDIVTKFIDFDMEGKLTIRADYAWDGASGPTFDTDSAMRGPLPHDAGYQLIRLGLLDRKIYKPQFDLLIFTLMMEDGIDPVPKKNWLEEEGRVVLNEAWTIHCKAWYDAVTVAGGSSVDPKNEKKELCAPKKNCREIEAP
jgi:hypothetical protein